MANRYWVGGSGTWDSSSTANWSTTSGGASGASAPTTADAAIFDANSGTGTATAQATATAGTITVNTANVVLDLQGNVAITSSFTLTAGTVNLNSYTLTTSNFTSSNSNVRAINFGTGKFVITGTGGGFPWGMGTITNLTVLGTPVVDITYSGAVALTVSTGALPEASAISFNFTAGTYALTFAFGSTYKSLNFTGFNGSIVSTTPTVYGDFTLGTGTSFAGGTSVITFASTNATPRTITSNGRTIDQPLTFNGIGGTFLFADALTQGSTRAFTITNGTVKLKNGVTSTVGAFATSGANLKYLASTSAGSAATLSQASGTVSVSNLSIKDITATGGATWNAFVENNNINAGGNTGWDFGLGPVYDIEFSPALRSFTERNRF